MGTVAPCPRFRCVPLAFVGFDLLCACACACNCYGGTGAGAALPPQVCLLLLSPPGVSVRLVCLCGWMDMTGSPRSL